MKPLATSVLLLASYWLPAQDLALSPTFGTDGVLSVDVATAEDNLRSQGMGSDGRMIFGGDGYDIGANAYHVSLVVIDTVCGTLDAGFGNGGKISHIFEQRTKCQSIAIQPDGKIVGCGMIAPDNSGSLQWAGVYRFLADGSVDTSFNHTGYHRLHFAASAGDFNKVWVNANGTITCAAAAFGGVLGVCRFLEDGSLDTTYNQTGIATAALSNFALSGEGTGLMLDDGSVISIVVAYNGVDYALAMAKFDSEGAVDPGFGTNGVVVGTVPVRSGGSMGVASQPDGKFLVSCSSTNANIMVMARFLEDGSVDTTYGTDGYASASSAGTSGNAMLLLQDGATLQFGQVGGLAGVLKRDADGAPVASFGNGGFLGIDAGLPNAQNFMGGVLMPSGRFMSYGNASGVEAYIARLTTTPLSDALPSISLIGADLVTNGSGTFQWHLDGAPINGAIGNTLTPLVNGTYTVTMTISSDCEYTSAPYEMLNVSLIEHAPSAVRILNDPATDNLVVMNHGPAIRYELMGLQGAVLRSGLLPTGRSVLGLSGLSSGAYLIRTTSHGASDMQRIIRY